MVSAADSAEDFLRRTGNINEFLQCSNEFTKCITIGIGSLDNEYLTETLKVMIQWIEVLIEQPKIQMKC